MTIRSTPSGPRHTLPTTGRGRSPLMNRPPKLSHARRATQSTARLARWSALLAIVLSAAAATPTVHGASASSTVNSGGAPQLGGFSARALDENGQVTPQTYFELKLKRVSRSTGRSSSRTPRRTSCA